MQPVATLNCGMVTGVGSDTPSSCAAIRVGINAFAETRFRFDGDWLIGSAVQLEEGLRGRERLLEMAGRAIEECISGVDASLIRQIPLLLCVAETERPGRFQGLGDSFLRELQVRMNRSFHASSLLVQKGRIGGVYALDRARQLVAEGAPFCVVAGVDTYLVDETLRRLVDQQRVQTANNSDGFIPGEGAAAIMLGPTQAAPRGALHCLGLGYGIEPAFVGSGLPFRAEGLVAALKAALAEAGLSMARIDYRITDLSGEQYGFKEAALALARVLRDRKPEVDLWHPADCVGEVGAATLPVLLAVANAAASRGYAPGANVLCHLAGDDGRRAAVVLAPKGRIN